MNNEPFLSDERARLLSNHGAPHAKGNEGLGKSGPKSLFFCLVLDNPFDPENLETRVVDNSLFLGEPESPDAPPSGLSDDELLLEPPTKNGFIKSGTDAAPNKFQKVIEIILRMQTRHIDFVPHNMIRLAPEKRAEFEPNYYFGYELVKENLLSSPDGDEMYIKLHGSREVLLQFAESQGVILNTHPFSFTGGAPQPYSKDMEKKLAESVSLFASAFPYEFEGEDDIQSTAAKKKAAEGFILDVPDKMRLIARLMREAWKYGGCGLQIAEMKRKGILVRHFFPLHNPAYVKAYQLDKWGSFKQLFTRDPLYQVEEHIIKYFGEEVALYFVWIRKYTLFLRYIAFFGLVAAIIGYTGKYNSHVHDYMPISLVNAIFSLICVVWGVAWNFSWIRFESTFAIRHGQEAMMRQELVRDEFERDSEVEISIPDIYKCRFDYPLTLKTKADGTMVDLHSSAARRNLVRYGVSYPIILILASGMVVALIFNTKWRFMFPDDERVSYGSSVVTVLIGFVFGLLFDKIVPTLNAWENNRTDSEEASQTISKSFLFYFLSFYFAMFTIALWPGDADGKTDNSRLDQLASQMVIITLVKPMVQNAQELFLPWFNGQLRRRTDVYGSTVKAICSILCCQSVKDAEKQPTNELEEEGQRLWLETQQEPYESTSGDYLEITLQYGFMTMFAATFPLATVAALLYNALEIRVDARKLLYECQRPVAAPAVSIGAWNSIFFFLATISVITNGYLISILSPFPKQIHLPLDEATRFKVFTVAQYIFVSGFFMMHLWQGGASLWSNKVKAKYFILSNKGTMLKMRKMMEEEARRSRNQPQA